MESAYIRLINFLYNCDRLGGDYFIAKILLDNYGRFPDILIEDIARQANTTPATVTKFIHKLGYGSFKEFRNDILIENKDETWKKTLDLAKGNIMEATEYFRQTEEQKIKNCFLNLSGQIKDTLVDELDQAKQIGIIYPRYGYTAVHAVRVYLQPFSKKVDAILRDEDDTQVIYRIKACDLVFLICFSGRWVNEHIPVMETILQQNKTIVLLCIKPGNEYYFHHIIRILDQGGNNILDSGTQLSYFFALMCMKLSAIRSKNPT